MLVMRVPQVTCPNCGTTINLENRKEIDLDMIRNAARRQPKTFTELLHITKLSRKTLSLRLKELCESGMLIKNEGVYKLNGVSEFGSTRRVMSNGLSKVLNDRRMRTGLMLIAFLLCSSATGYVLATFIMPPRDAGETPPPVVIGYFAMSLEVENAKNLAGWQAWIGFDMNKMEVVGVTRGSIFGGATYYNASNPYGNELTIGGVVYEPVEGISGDGSLAIVTFGYYVAEYELPTLLAGARGQETVLRDPQLQPLESGALTLKLVVG